MSGSTTATITVPSPPAVADVVADMMAWLGGQTGVVTDINTGSQVRTDAEALGSVVEMQAVIAQAEVFQAIVYSAWAAFGISPLTAVFSVGTVTFSTSSGANPPPASISVSIPQGTLLSTVGGIQFETLTAVTLAAGQSSVTANVQAVTPGQVGNVAPSAITQIVTALSYPLQVLNAAPMTGGADAETSAETMARFTAAVASIGLATPVAIANGVIGVSVSGTSEKVEYATVYEPWIIEASEGVPNPTPGFVVYVDNGSGAASSNLLSAVQTVLSGNQQTGAEGFRPAGVPYSVAPVSPLYCDVIVSGAALYTGLDQSLEAAASTAVTTYFASLGFGVPAESTQLVAAVANVVAGNINTLSIMLNDTNGVSQQQIVPTGSQRVVTRNTLITFG